MSNAMLFFTPEMNFFKKKEKREKKNASKNEKNKNKWLCCLPIQGSSIVVIPKHQCAL